MKLFVCILLVLLASQSLMINGIAIWVDTPLGDVDVGVDVDLRKRDLVDADVDVDLRKRNLLGVDVNLPGVDVDIDI